MTFDATKPYRTRDWRIPFLRPRDNGKGYVAWLLNGRTWLLGPDGRAEEGDGGLDLVNEAEAPRKQPSQEDHADDFGPSRPADQGWRSVPRFDDLPAPDYAVCGEPGTTDRTHYDYIDPKAHEAAKPLKWNTKGDLLQTQTEPSTPPLPPPPSPFPNNHTIPHPITFSGTVQFWERIARDGSVSVHVTYGPDSASVLAPHPRFALAGRLIASARVEVMAGQFIAAAQALPTRNVETIHERIERKLDAILTELQVHGE